MSTESFIRFLQELLTMIDKNNKYSVAYAKNLLSGMAALAVTSDKVDAYTRRIMMRAEGRFEVLAEHADEFAGEPGSFYENGSRRKRLLEMLHPSC